MRVLVSPRLDLTHNRAAALIAEALAGPGGVILGLAERGVRNLERLLTQAEVSLVRQALLDAKGSLGVVGYLCLGSGLNGVSERRAVSVVAVTDHANLTWRSPLIGPNDDVWGPRFPSMTGVYAPELVVDGLRGLAGMIVTSGIVAGVADDRRLSGFESELAEAEGYVAASSELVAPVIVAAHMGLRVGAAVLVE